MVACVSLPTPLFKQPAPWAFDFPAQASNGLLVALALALAPPRSATASMGSTFNPALFDAASPQQFYLPRRSSGETPDADTVLLVEGRQLECHSQIVGFKSGLLAMLFKDFAPPPLAAGGSAAAEVGGGRPPCTDRWQAISAEFGMVISCIGATAPVIWAHPVPCRAAPGNAGAWRCRCQRALGGRRTP